MEKSDVSTQEVTNGESRPVKKRKKGLVAATALLLAAVLGAAALFLLRGGENCQYFYVQDGNLCYSPAKGKVQLLSRVEEDDMDLLQSLTAVNGETLIYPGLNGNGTYDLYTKDIKGQNSQLLIADVKRAESLDAGRMLIEDEQRTLHLYSGGAVTPLVKYVRFWERCADVNAICYVARGKLVRLDLDAMKTVDIVSDLDQSGPILSDGTGNVFRYTKKGALYVYTGGKETKLPQGAKILAEEALDRLYMYTAVPFPSTVGNFIIDDMADVDRSIKEPKISDYEYEVWHVEFNGTMYVNFVPEIGVTGNIVPGDGSTFSPYRVSPQAGSVSDEFRSGSLSAYDYLNQVLAGKAGGVHAVHFGRNPYPFSKEEVDKLARFFTYRIETDRITGKQTYDGDYIWRTVDGITYNMGMYAESTNEKALRGDRYWAAQDAYKKAYKEAEARNTIRQALNQSLGTTYTLYQFTPEQGLVSLARNLYRCNVSGGSIVATASLSPTPTEKVFLSKVTSIDDYRLNEGEEVLNIPLNPEQKETAEETVTPELPAEFPAELKERYPDAVAALKLTEGGHWVYLLPSEDNALYLYDGAKNTLIDQGVTEGEWAGESGRCVYYLKDGGLYRFNGKSTKRLAENVSRLW